MKATRFSLFPIVFLFLANVSLVVAADGPLQVSPLLAGWKLEYQGTSEPALYSVTLPEDRGLLMFFKWPTPERAEDIPAWVQKFADGFVTETKKSPEYTLTSEKYVIEQFAGDHCKGSYALFQIKSIDPNSVQTSSVFMMSVDGQIRTGQFTGKSDDWMEALKLLKTISKNG